jgi:predicted PP-loop superfamily ATPase
MDDVEAWGGMTKKRRVLFGVVPRFVFEASRSYREGVRKARASPCGTGHELKSRPS